MFAYCGNNPVSYSDSYGTYSQALQTWSGTAWVLCGVDGPLFVGEAVYLIGILVLGIAALTSFDIEIPQIYTNAETPELELPEVEYPGDDPTVAPEGYEWRGPDEQGGERGGYANPDGKDSWHPDLDHPDGIEPHWDYNDGAGHKWRVFPDRIEPVIK